MDIYAINDLGQLLATNPYPGRGIVIGKSADGISYLRRLEVRCRYHRANSRVTLVKVQCHSHHSCILHKRY